MLVSRISSSPLPKDDRHSSDQLMWSSTRSRVWSSLVLIIADSPGLYFLENISVIVFNMQKSLSCISILTLIIYVAEHMPSAE